MAQVLFKTQGALKAILVEADTVGQLKAAQSLTNYVVMVNGVVASDDKALSDGDKVVAAEQQKGA